MKTLLMVLSKDPHTTETPDLVLNIGLDAKAKGNEVSLYLVEDGVTAARRSEFGNRLAAAQKKGVKIYADDRAVLSRALTDKMIGSVQVKEIGALLDLITGSDRVVWF